MKIILCSRVPLLNHLPSHNGQQSLRQGLGGRWFVLESDPREQDLGTRTTKTGKVRAFSCSALIGSRLLQLPIYGYHWAQKHQEMSWIIDIVLSSWIHAGNPRCTVTSVNIAMPFFACWFLGEGSAK